MKHVDLFNDFLKDVVNLNDTRVSELEKSTEAIKDAVRASDWKPRIKGWMAQGSWAHKTIIKPVDQGEFNESKKLGAFLWETNFPCLCTNFPAEVSENSLLRCVGNSRIRSLFRRVFSD